MLDFMYVKLKKAVPNVWLKNIPDIATQNSTHPNDSDIHTFEIKTLDVINLSKIKSKHIYDIINNFQKSDVTVLAFWEEKFNLPVDFNWKDILKFKFKTLKSNKVKQYNF